MIQNLRIGKLISVLKAEIMSAILRTNGLFSAESWWHISV